MKKVIIRNLQICTTKQRFCFPASTGHIVDEGTLIAYVRLNINNPLPDSFVASTWKLPSPPGPGHMGKLKTWHLETGRDSYLGQISDWLKFSQRRSIWRKPGYDNNTEVSPCFSVSIKSPKRFVIVRFETNYLDVEKAGGFNDTRPAIYHG